MPTDKVTFEKKVKFASGLSIFFGFHRDRWMACFKIHLTKFIFYWHKTDEFICNISCVLWIFMRWFPVIYSLRLRIQCAFFYVLLFFCCAVFIINFNMVYRFFWPTNVNTSKYLNMHFNKSWIFLLYVRSLSVFILQFHSKKTIFQTAY